MQNLLESPEAIRGDLKLTVGPYLQRYSAIDV